MSAAGTGVGRLGDRVLDGVAELGAFARLALDTARAAFRSRFPLLETLRQMRVDRRALDHDRRCSRRSSPAW